MVSNISSRCCHLPDLDELAAGAAGDHVAVVRDPDPVHVLVVVLVTPPEPARTHLQQYTAFSLSLIHI